jgi:competence protein ComEC
VSHIALLFKYRIKRTNLIKIGLISLLLGIGFGQNFLHIAEVLILPMSIIVLALARCKSIAVIVPVVCCCFLIGQARGHAYARQLNQYKNLYKHSVELTGIVQDDGSYSKYKQMSFTLSDIRINNQKLPGKLQVSGFGANAVYEGDKIQARGKLYYGYSSYQGRLSYANIEVQSRGDSWVAKLRRHFSAGISNSLPDPAAPFAMGILIGQRSALPDNLKKDLLMVGLTHIIAVSGYNLTIILEASKKIIGHSKRLSTMLSLSLVVIFLLITGSSASIVRASIVSLLSLMAGYHGRRIKPLIIILLTAVITAWANPVYVWSDIGWYLSFLAFFGVLIIAPLIKERLNWKILESIVGSVALESICAEIMALPYVVHVFGQMSLIGLLANILIVGLIPLAMLLSLISGIFGMLFSNISSLIAWPCAILLNSMLGTAHILASIPGIFIENIKLSLGYMLTLYLLVLLFIVVLTCQDKKPKIC